MANLYLVEIIVISSLGPEGRTVISPQNCEPVARVFLGHFSEDEGIHYVCLVANNGVNQESGEKTDSSKKRKGNENILKDVEENEDEQNDYENSIEDNIVLSNDEQNVTNLKNTVKNKKNHDNNNKKIKYNSRKNNMKKNNKEKKLQRKLNWNRCQRRSLI